MKKLLCFLFFCGVIVSCGKTDLPSPIGFVPANSVPPGATLPGDPEPINTTKPDNKIVELTGPIFVNGLPLLKKVDDSVNGISEYFYDEFKREVRITKNKFVIAETRYKYNGDLKIEVNFTRNPDYVSPSPQMVFNLSPQFFEYDNKNRVIVRKSSSGQDFYAYNDTDNTVQVSSRSSIETNPQTRPSNAYRFDKKGNMIEMTQEGQINEYTYDDKIRPNSFSLPSSSAYPGGVSKSNVLSERVTGGWFGDSFTTYKYTYNKYNLPITSTSNKGDVITYTYYE